MLISRLLKKAHKHISQAVRLFLKCLQMLRNINSLISGRWVSLHIQIGEVEKSAK